MSKVVGIAIGLYLFGFFASWVVEDLRVLVLSTSIVSLASIGLGIAVFPKRTATFVLDLPTSETIIDTPIVVGGQEFRLSPWRKVLVCQLRVTRFERLLGSLFGACAMIVIVLKHEYSTAALRDGLGMFRVEAIGFAGLFVLVNALFWLRECARLRHTSAALAVAISRSWRQSPERLAFNFFDHERNRRGGSSPVPPTRPGMQEDNALVVFFREDDPDDNLSQHALKFHRLVVALAPAINVNSEVASETEP